MKKIFIRLLFALLITVSICLIIAILCFCVFLKNTISSKNMLEFCKQESGIQSTDYIRFSTESLPHYAFLVSRDNTSPYQQEIFIFRKTVFWDFLDLDRFKFEHKITGNMDSVVSYFEFNPRNLDGEKQATNTMVIFSSNPKNIVYYEIEIEENTKRLFMKGKVSQRQSFLIDVVNLGISDTTTRSFIEAKFFDEDKNLVDEIKNME